MQVFTSKIALEAKTDCDYNRLQSWMKKGAQSMECTKKKRIRQIITATTAVLLCCAPTVYANASEQKTALVDEEETLEYDSNRIYVSGTTGWVIENNHWCYYINGVKQTGSLYTQEGEYLLDSNGYMVTGWYRKDANAPYVYYDPQKGGVRAYGLTTVNGVTYYFYGYMRTDYAVVENGVFYYFGEDGALANQMNGVSDGWLLIGSDWYYVENGVLFGGLKTIGGATYYFDQGKMVTNARRMVHDSSSNTDKWYEFDANGHMIVGWSLDSDGIWYYYNSDGASASGMKTIGAATYYFAADGHMCTNYSVSIGEVMYYFGNDGVLSNTQSKPSDGWKLMTDGWYYFRNGSMIKSEFLTQGNITWYLDENGKMCTNQEKLIDGAWYRFDANGYMITGWYGANDGSWYYYGSNGQAGNGFTQIGNVWYYLEYNGYMITSSWKQIGDVWYYLTPSGNMAVGWYVVDGSWYFFDASGAMAEGWRQLGSNWYYLMPGGKMAVGWCVVDGSWYFFDTSGVMAEGWRQIGNNWYYLMPGGKMAVGWCVVDSNWYYFDTNGAMLADRWVDYVYYVKTSGAMAKDEWVDHNRYYVNSNGVWAN